MAAIPLLAVDERDSLNAAPATRRRIAATLLRQNAALLVGASPDARPVHRLLADAWRPGDEAFADLVRAALVLCADHELNVSAFAARVVASTGAHLHGTVCAGLSALTGPRHGGATARAYALIDDAAAAGLEHVTNAGAVATSCPASTTLTRGRPARCRGAGDVAYAPARRAWTRSRPSWRARTSGRLPTSTVRWRSAMRTGCRRAGAGDVRRAPAAARPRPGSRPPDADPAGALTACPGGPRAGPGRTVAGATPAPRGVSPWPSSARKRADPLPPQTEGDVELPSPAAGWGGLGWGYPSRRHPSTDSLALQPPNGPPPVSAPPGVQPPAAMLTAAALRTGLPP